VNLFRAAAMQAELVKDYPRPPAGIVNPFDSRRVEARWRVSPDVLASLAADFFPGEPIRGPYQLLGWPVDVDETLPPDSMLLEPVADPLPLDELQPWQRKIAERTMSGKALVPVTPRHPDRALEEFAAKAEAALEPDPE
jgi:hypothetical protein